MNHFILSFDSRLYDILIDVCDAHLLKLILRGEKKNLRKKNLNTPAENDLNPFQQSEVK